MTILFTKAFVGLLAFDICGFSRNFKRLHHTVSTWRPAKTTPVAGLVEQVCEAVNYACSFYPKRVRCLQRSVVTACLLRAYGVPAQMVFGAQDLPFKAHAWVEVEGCPINERTDVQSNFEVFERC
jgi:ABC-type uncharacterized transport system permease subunit